MALRLSVLPGGINVGQVSVVLPGKRRHTVFKLICYILCCLKVSYFKKMLPSSIGNDATGHYNPRQVIQLYYLYARHLYARQQNKFYY